MDFNQLISTSSPAAAESPPGNSTAASLVSIPTVPLPADYYFSFKAHYDASSGACLNKHLKQYENPEDDDKLTWPSWHGVGDDPPAGYVTNPTAWSFHIARFLTGHLMYYDPNFGFFMFKVTPDTLRMFYIHLGQNIEAKKVYTADQFVRAVMKLVPKGYDEEKMKLKLTGAGSNFPGIYQGMPFISGLPIKLSNKCLYCPKITAAIDQNKSINRHLRNKHKVVAFLDRFIVKIFSQQVSGFYEHCSHPNKNDDDEKFNRVMVAKPPQADMSLKDPFGADDGARGFKANSKSYAPPSGGVVRDPLSDHHAIKTFKYSLTDMSIFRELYKSIECPLKVVVFLLMNFPTMEKAILMSYPLNFYKEWTTITGVPEKYRSSQLKVIEKTTTLEDYSKISALIAHILYSHALQYDPTGVFHLPKMGVTSESLGSFCVSIINRLKALSSMSIVNVVASLTLENYDFEAEFAVVADISRLLLESISTDVTVAGKTSFLYSSKPTELDEYDEEGDLEVDLEDTEAHNYDNDSEGELNAEHIDNEIAEGEGPNEGDADEEDTDEEEGLDLRIPESAIERNIFLRAVLAQCFEEYSGKVTLRSRSSICREFSKLFYLLRVSLVFEFLKEVDQYGFETADQMMKAQLRMLSTRTNGLKIVTLLKSAAFSSLSLHKKENFSVTLRASSVLLNKSGKTFDVEKIHQIVIALRKQIFDREAEIDKIINDGLAKRITELNWYTICEQEENFEETNPGFSPIRTVCKILEQQYKSFVATWHNDKNYDEAMKCLGTLKSELKLLMAELGLYIYLTNSCGRVSQLYTVSNFNSTQKRTMTIGEQYIYLDNVVKKNDSVGLDVVARNDIGELFIKTQTKYFMFFTEAVRKLEPQTELKVGYFSIFFTFDDDDRFRTAFNKSINSYFRNEVNSVRLLRPLLMGIQKLVQYDANRNDLIDLNTNFAESCGHTVRTQLGHYLQESFPSQSADKCFKSIRNYLVYRAYFIDGRDLQKSDFRSHAPANKTANEKQDSPQQEVKIEAGVTNEKQAVVPQKTEKVKAHDISQDHEIIEISDDEENDNSAATNNQSMSVPEAISDEDEDIVALQARLDRAVKRRALKKRRVA